MISVRRPASRDSGTTKLLPSMSRRIRSSVVRLGATLAVVSIAGVSLLGGAASASATPQTTTQTTTAALATAEPEAGSVSVVFGALDNGVLVPGQDLQLSLSIRNGTTEDIDGGSIEILLSDELIDSRADLTTWLAPVDDARTDADLILNSLDLRVSAGSTAQLTLVVPATSIGFSTEPYSTGTYGLEAVVNDATDTVATARSTIEWNTGATQAQTAVSIAVPITVPSTSAGLLSADDLENYTSPAGTLTRQLDAVIGKPVAIGIDPRIIASVRILGESAPESATAWVQRLQNAPNQTFALQYADADVSVEAQSDADTLLSPTSFESSIDGSLFAPAPSPTPTPTDTVTPTPTSTSPAADGSTTSLAGSASAAVGETDAPSQTTEELPAETPTPTPTPTDQPQQGDLPQRPTLESLLAFDYDVSGLVWPRSNTISTTDLPVYTASGSTATVTASDNLRYTGSTPLGTTASVDGATLLVSDSPVTSSFVDAATASSDADFRSAVAELSSEIAVLEREAPTGSAQLFIAVDRATAEDGYRLSQTIDTLATLPWYSPNSLSNALAASPTSGVTVTDASAGEQRLETAASILQRSAEIDAFSTVLDTPELLSGEHRLEVLALLSTAWADESSEWTAAVAESLSASYKTLHSVSIEQSSTILLVSRDTAIPISVRNDLRWPVTIGVQASTSNGILDIDEAGVEDASIDAGSQGRALIPVKARVGNGETSLRLQLTSTTGVPIDTPSSIQFNVRADWETFGTLIFAVLVVGVFGLGLVRNINKRRRGEVADDEPDPNAVLEHQPGDPVDDTTTPRG